MFRALVILAALSATLAGSLKKPSQGIFASGPSDTPIATTPPNLPGGTIANDAPPGPFFRDFQPPFPTDAWWSGLTVTNQDAVLAGPFPFQTRTLNTGLVFGISDNREFDGTSIKVPTQEDWRVSFTGLPDALTNRKALSWDTQTVCLRYLNDGEATTMDTCLVPGSPYLTFTFKNAQVVLTSLKEQVALEWVTPGKKAKVTSAGGTYIIYSVDSTLDLTLVGQVLTSPAGFSGTIRVAKLTAANQEALLDTHSVAYATGLEMSYQVTGDVSTETWTWTVVGNPAELLILSWPHHRAALQGPNFVNIEYLTLKGPMKGIAGNTWVQKHNLPTISWFAENDPQESCKAELIKTLEAEVNALEVMIPGDFYFWGGSFGRASRLALIAEHVGRSDLIDHVVDILKQSIAFWFDPAHVPAAAYETGWGGFINKEGWNNTWVDFGNGYYNDHHFHYGYLLHGAAVIGKYDAAWLNQNIDFLTHVARGIGNPSPNDPHYTVTRHLDFFAGHSWASGIANGAGGRDQESSGEAINGYYGLLLFAHAINNQALIDWSRHVLAVEILGAQTYWHLYPNANDEETAYPEKGFRDLTTVGNVMDWQTGAWLFWGAERTQIAAIQILPLTPIGQETYDSAWLEGVLPYCQAELDDPNIGDAFKSVIYAAYAKVNPQVAYGYSENLFDWGTGNSASNQLYFVATQTSASDICTAASATPEGLFTIQDVASGLFITAGDGSLTATTSADVLGTKFSLGFTPGGGMIKSLSNGKYVSASPDGQIPLSPSRDTYGGYEVFRWTAEGDGIYTLKAMVNKAFVSTNANDGKMLNNGNSTNGIAASKYRLVAAQEPEPTPVPATGRLRSVSSNQYVVSTAATPVLMATAGAAGDATLFGFEKVADSPTDSPYYTIKNQVTGQYVTGNIDGTAPLSANTAVPAAWEYFQVVGYQNANILIHIASGKAVAVQPDNTLVDNNNSIGTVALWTIE